MKPISREQYEALPAWLRAYVWITDRCIEFGCVLLSLTYAFVLGTALSRGYLLAALQSLLSVGLCVLILYLVTRMGRGSKGPRSVEKKGD